MNDRYDKFNGQKWQTKYKNRNYKTEIFPSIKHSFATVEMYNIFQFNSVFHLRYSAIWFPIDNAYFHRFHSRIWLILLHSKWNRLCSCEINRYRALCILLLTMDAYLNLNFSIHYRTRNTIIIISNGIYYILDEIISFLWKLTKFFKYNNHFYTG